VVIDPFPTLNVLTIRDMEVYTGSGNCPTSSVRCMFVLIAQEFTMGELRIERVKGVEMILISSFSASIYNMAG
jgi:hypothetical protein